MPLPDDLIPISNPEPTIGSFAERAYEAMQMYAEYDEQLGWSLKTFIGALGAMWQPIEDIVADDDATDSPGWSKAVDLDRAPSEFLAFIAMFVGVRLRAGLDDTSQRDRIRSTDGMHRGSASAFVAAAQQRLPEGSYVLINERQQDNAWRVAVRTRASETPDPNQVLADLLEQKPAGIILDYATIATLNYGDLAAAFDTYADMDVRYNTYEQIATELP